MSVKYIPVQWNKVKWYYDGIMLAAVVFYLWFFIAITPSIMDHDGQITFESIPGQGTTVQVRFPLAGA